MADHPLGGPARLPDIDDDQDYAMSGLEAHHQQVAADQAEAAQATRCWICTGEFSADLMHEDGTCPGCRQRHERDNPEPQYCAIELWGAGAEGTAIDFMVRGSEVTGTHASCGYKLTGSTVGGVLDGMLDECGCERSLHDRFVGG